MRAQAKSKANALIAAIMAAIFAFSLIGVPTSSLAAEGKQEDSGITISGVDFMQPSSPTWEVLRVNGLGNQDIFITVKEGDIPLSDPVKYVPTGHDGTGDNIAQIVTVDIAKDGKQSAIELMDPDNPTKFSVEVRNVGFKGAKPIKTLTIYPIYALILDSNGEPVLDSNGNQVKNLIGIRTCDSSEEPSNSNIGVAQTYYTQGADQSSPISCSLVPSEAGTDNDFRGGAFYVTYQQNDASSVTGTINYVCDGVVVKSETVTGVDAGVTTFNIPKTISVRDDANSDDPTKPAEYTNYRVISNLGGSTVSFSTNPEKFCTSYTVQVIKLPSNDKYTATIEYVDTDGNKLWTDELYVKGDGYYYTVPNTFSMKNSDGVRSYRLTEISLDGKELEGDDIANQTQAGSVVKLSATGDQTVKAVYKTSMFETDFTLQIIDGSTGEVLETIKETITKDGDGFNYPLNDIKVNGTTYVPWVGNEDTDGNPLTAVTYEWADLAKGKELLQRVYYVPEGYTPGETKSITVQYKNIANGQVLRSEVFELTPENNYVTVTGVERFNYNGAEFVRLPGQESGIRHAYFSPSDVYTIWYRDVNDSQNENVTIGGFQNPNGDAPGGLEAVGGEDAGITAGDGTVIINDDDNPLANLDGVDTTTQRIIEDDENPLFSGALAQNGFAIASLAIGAIALVGLVVYFLLRRRNKSNENQNA